MANAKTNKKTITVHGLKLADAKNLTFDFLQVSDREYKAYIRELRKTITVKFHPKMARWSAECTAIMNNGYSVGKTAEAAWKSYIRMVNACCNFK